MSFQQHHGCATEQRLLVLVLATAFPTVFATAPFTMAVLATSNLRMGAPPLKALARCCELDLSFFAWAEVSRSRRAEFLSV